MQNHLESLRKREPNEIIVDTYFRDARQQALVHASEHSENVSDYDRVFAETIDALDEDEQNVLRSSRRSFVSYHDGVASVQEIIHPELQNNPVILYRLKDKVDPSKINVDDPDFTPMHYVEAGEIAAKKKGLALSTGKWHINPGDAVYSATKRVPKPAPKRFIDGSENIPQISLEEFGVNEQELETFSDDDVQMQPQEPTVIDGDANQPSIDELAMLEHAGERVYSSDPLSKEELFKAMDSQSITAKDLKDMLIVEHQIDVDQRKISNSWLKKGVPEEYAAQVRETLGI